MPVTGKDLENLKAVIDGVRALGVPWFCGCFLHEDGTIWHVNQNDDGKLSVEPAPESKATLNMGPVPQVQYLKQTLG